MGMYTEFFFRAELKLDRATDQAVELLRNSGMVQPTLQAEHPFFHCSRWTMLLNGGSAYHPTRGFHLPFAPKGDSPKLFIHSSFKNYEEEIEKFMDWIDPMVDEPAGTFLGYSLYEQDEQPTLYYKKG